jgi:hypothetical protein
VFAEIMQDALRAMRVPPSAVAPGTTSQWDAAWVAARSEGVDCGVPHGSALAELLADRATAAIGANGTGAASPATTADTLPAATVHTDPAG